MVRHLGLIDEEIRRLVCREIPERVLVIRMPPRHGKSELISHWAPAWFEANWPDRNTLLTSYEATFAESWGRKARDTFKEVTAEYGHVLPGRISPDRQSAGNWGTVQGGYMATAGVGGPVTGKGFHLGICDDLIKNAEQAQSETYRDKVWEWFTSTFWSRREPEGVLVVIGTPWHRDDYLARLRTWDEPTRELCLPAICESPDDPLSRADGEALWPERFDEHELESIKKAQGPYYWSALYQQRPSQHEQAEWPSKYFDGSWARMIPDPENIAYSVVMLDPSLGRTDKSDYSAFVWLTVMHHGMVYAEADLQRRDLVQLADDAIEHCHRIKPIALGVEANGFQALSDLIEQRAGGAGLPIATVTQHKNKLVRIRLGVGPLLASGRLKFLEGQRGTQLLVDQLRDFPLADYDDGPDALEGAIRLARAVDAGEHLPTEEVTRIIA